MMRSKIEIRYGLMYILISILLLCPACKKESPSELTVMEGKFVQSFIETGSLSAILSAPIPVPRMDYRFGYEFKIVEMLDNGTYVKKGDTLIMLDDAPIRKFILTQEESLEKERAAAKRQAVMSRNAIQELQASIKSQEMSFELKKLSMERAKFEPPQKQRIKKLEFRQAEIRMEKLKRHLRIKPIMNSCDEKIHQIRVSQKEAELQKAIEALEKMYVISPKDGLFEVGKNHRTYPPQDLKIGDKVHQNSMIAQIPNVDKMEVNSYINETDYTKVSVGSKVIVRLDALPNVPFDGEITEIARSCVKVNNKMVFKVKVVIEASDIRLKPGMTVSCEYICYQGENELYVPNECVYVENGKAFVFLKKGGKNRKVEVTALRSNSHHTIIEGKVRAGQGLLPFSEVINQKSL